MTDPEGYRDIHRIETGADLKRATPERLGSPRWKISGCPMAGPVTAGGLTWFLDGSDGTRKLLEASSPTAEPVPVPAATVERPASPRIVAGSEGPAWMLYLPGRPHGQILIRDGGRWRVQVDDVPYFCTDVAFVGGQLLMVGDKEGTLWMEATALN
jgi:hypothetical protein